MPVSRSERIDVGGFGALVIVIGGCCTIFVIMLALGAVDVGWSDSRSGVIFFRRPRFFVGDSNRSSGGLANSTGSMSLVLCTVNSVGGMSGFWPGMPSMADDVCGIGGRGSLCGGRADACAMTEDVCWMADGGNRCRGGRPCANTDGIFNGMFGLDAGGSTDVCLIADSGGSG